MENKQDVCVVDDQHVHGDFAVVADHREVNNSNTAVILDTIGL
jgi:hypothetical protein